MKWIFGNVCQMSLIGTYAVFIVLLARLLLRRCPRRLAVLLWAAVFLRLACPVFPGGPFSLIPKPVASFQTGLTSSGVEMESPARMQEDESIAGENLPADPGAYAEPGLLTPGLDGLDERAGLEQEEAEGSAGILDVLAEILPYIWLSGALILWIYHAASYLRLKRGLLGAVPKEPGVYELPQKHLSFVFGLLHPVIYLSADLEPEARRVILCHEQAHLKYRDYIVKPLVLAVACVHWFNPFVWLAVRLMNRDMEIACDERVVQILGEESKECYSRALLHAAKELKLQDRREKNHVCALLSFGEDSVKERISRVLRYRRAPVWLLAFSVLAVLLIAAGLLSNPANALSEKEAVRLVLSAEGEGCCKKDPEDETEVSFAASIAAQSSADGNEWLGTAAARRAFAEEIRRCLEHEDAAGMYRLMASAVHTASGQTAVEDEASFASLYADIFTPEVKAAVMAADFNQLFSNWQGVCIGDGVIWFQPDTWSDGALGYQIYSVNQPGTGIANGSPDLKRDWVSLCQRYAVTREQAEGWYEQMLDDGVFLDDSYQFGAFYMGDWDASGEMDWIFWLEPRNGADLPDTYEESWVYSYQNGSLLHAKASPDDVLWEIENSMSEFTLEPGFGA